MESPRNNNVVCSVSQHLHPISFRATRNSNSSPSGFWSSCISMCDTGSVPECGRLWVTMMPDNPPVTKASMQKCRHIRHHSHTFKFSRTADATYSNCRRINARQQAKCPYDHAGPMELSCRTPRTRITHHNARQSTMHRHSDTCHMCAQKTRCHSPPGGEFMSPNHMRTHRSLELVALVLQTQTTASPLQAEARDEHHGMNHMTSPAHGVDASRKINGQLCRIGEAKSQGPSLNLTRIRPCGPLERSIPLDLQAKPSSLLKGTMQSPKVT